ncbi:M23 family metallopeptidase [Thalassolituus maritimus]|uniref:M23ase beta-sheet core domain-containing protein n=1 Tax=Thalassolituus maritimus TaxID=484498 RepID=A0ABQ0A1L6_9GAMM
MNVRLGLLFAVFFISSCGGEDGDDSEQLVGYGGSEFGGRCDTWDQGSNWSPDRATVACNYAQAAFKSYEDSSSSISLNIDFGDDKNYLTGKKHTGVDVQGLGDLSRSHVASIVNGIVETLDVENGYVGIRTILHSAGPVMIAYMHMDNIQVQIGDSVAIGDVLGNEGSKSNYNTSTAPHLHIEAHKCSAQYRTLSIAPNDVYTWGDSEAGLEGHAIDPLSLYEDIFDATNPPREPNPFINACVPRDWTVGVQNELDGTVQTTGVIQFDIVDVAGRVLLTEEYGDPNEGLRTLQLSAYYFGQEDVFNTLERGEYGLRVSVNDGMRIATETYPFFLNRANPDGAGGAEEAPSSDSGSGDSGLDHTEPVEEVFSVSLNRAGSYLYFSEDFEIEGCLVSPVGVLGLEVTITDPDGNEYSSTYRTGDDDELEVVDDCEGSIGVEVDIIIDRYTQNFRNAIWHLGSFRVSYNVLLDSGEEIAFGEEAVEVISQVRDFSIREVPNGTVVSVRYVERQSDLHFVSRVECVRLGIDGALETDPVLLRDVELSQFEGYTGFSYRGQFVFVDEDAPIGALGDPLERGDSVDYEVYSDCGGNSPKVSLLTGFVVVE